MNRQNCQKIAPFIISYDLLNTRLVLPEEKDPEELALTIAGKKSNFNPESFAEFGKTIGLNTKQIQNIKKNLIDKRDLLFKTVEKSFLPDKMKSEYRDILDKRIRLL